MFDIFLADEDTKEINKEELTPSIPNFAQYLIVGGGTTAMSAFKSIRAHDPTAKVCCHSIDELHSILSDIIRSWSSVRRNICHTCVHPYPKIFGIRMMMK